MNSESFAEYLAKPAKLYQLPYQEIKNLIEEYPYAANLRLLAFIKSKIEQDPALESRLHQLAAHTFDRDHLFDLNQYQMKKMLDLASDTDERLELQDLNAIAEKELLSIDTEEEKEEELLRSKVINPVSEPVSVTRPGFEEEEEVTLEPITEAVEEKIDTKEEQLEKMPSLAEEEPKGVSFKINEELLKNIAVFPLLFVDGKPQEKQHFPSWRAFSEYKHTDRIKLLKIKAKQSVDGFEQASAKEIAAESLQQKSSVATETLAKLLESQGKYEKAIKMYEQLSLLNPEKSRLFAASIEKLKKKIRI